MAEGRMLKRNISISKKLPQLKTDSARMLWTWIIPYLDVEGRYYASPDLIKANVVPRINTFNEANIAEYLQDMATVGLIVIYDVDNELYLQYRKFGAFQSLRKDKEGKPLPGPPKDSRTTPVLLPDNSGSTPDEVKRSKGKLNLSKGKENEQELEIDHSDTTVDNSLSKEAFLQKYQELGEEISARFTDQRQQRQIALFVESHIKNGNLQAVVHCLESLLSTEKKNPVINPKAFLEKVFAVENGNYNAQEHEARSAEFKKPGAFASMKELMAAAPKGKHDGR